MARYLNEEEVRNEHLDVLGPDLGPVFHALFNECAWLHIQWNQFVELYGTKPGRIELLNRVAGLFFRVVQDALWHDTLIHLTRLTDPPSSTGKENLTLQRLPDLIVDTVFRAEIQGLVALAVRATDFARDWRNRRIAHQDLALTFKTNTKALAAASRNHVNDALQGVSRVLQRVYEFFFKSEIRFDLTPEPNGAVSLLYVIQDGIKAEDQRKNRLQEGKFDPEDIRHPREV